MAGLCNRITTTLKALLLRTLKSLRYQMWYLSNSNSRSLIAGLHLWQSHVLQRDTLWFGWNWFASKIRFFFWPSGVPGRSFRHVPGPTSEEPFHYLISTAIFFILHLGYPLAAPGSNTITLDTSFPRQSSQDDILPRSITEHLTYQRMG